MGSKRDQMTLEQCFEAIKQKQTAIQDVPFPDNQQGIQQQLDALQEITKDLKPLKRKVDEFRKSKKPVKEVPALETEYALLEDQALQKKRCLESVLYVSEVENVFQSAQTEFEERALYLTERRGVFDSMYRREHMEQSSRMHRDCVYTLRRSWGWLGTVARCMETHLQNAADYHQFFHESQYLCEDMQLYLAWLDSENMRERVETLEPSTIIKHIRDVTNRLLDYQSRVERLSDRSQDVYPIHLRKEVEEFGIKGRALVDYQQAEVHLREGEECVILNNLDSEVWQIRCKDGTETDVPGIVMIIPPPDKQAYNEAQRAKDQLQVNWETTIRRLRTQLAQYLTASAEDTTVKELYSVSTNQKAELMRLMNEAVQVLRPSPNQDDVDYRDLVAQATSFRKILSQVKPSSRDNQNGTTLTWQANGKALVIYKEFLTYAKTYRQTLATTREKAGVLISEKTGPTYCSKAYFEMAIPVVDIDIHTKQTAITKVRSELYIHERRPGKAPIPPPRRRQKLRRVASALSGDAAAIAGVIQETESFIITDVLDPKSKKQLSVFQALSNGILDQINGTYRNPATGEVMSIPEAIQKGFILADFRENLANGDVDAHNGGFAPMKNKMKTVKYPVEGVIDPKTGEWVGVKEAITAGIIDPRTGLYTNPLTGEQMSILEAVQNGYLVADPALLDEITEENGMYTCVDFSDVSHEVLSVLDPSTGEELSLKRAIQDGVIDPANSLYRNPHTGETMSVADAIKKGLIKVRPVDSSTPSENILTFKQLHIKKQRFIPGMGDIFEGDDIDGLHRDPNKKLADALRSKHDVSVPLAKTAGKREVSLEEAVSQGLIDFVKNEFCPPGGSPMSIEEAVEKGLISPQAAKQILDVYSENSIGQLIKDGKFDPDTGLVTDPNTGHTISLQGAIAQRIIDPNSVFLYDNQAGKVVSLASAIESGLFDPKTGKFVDPNTGEQLSLSEAVARGLVQTDINPDKIVDNRALVSKLAAKTDLSVKCVQGPNGELISLEDALKAGIIDLKNGKYVNPATGEIMSLADAIKSGKIDPRLVVPLLEALDEMSINDAAENGVLDLKTGMVIDPLTGDNMSVTEAVANGVFDPNSVMLVDNKTGNIVSLGALIESGQFDPRSGRYIDPDTKEKITLAEAIKRGHIDPEINPDQFADTSATLRDLIDSNKVNPRTTNFVTPNGQSMSLRDALANGFLTMTSKVKVDPSTGEVTLASEEEEVVQSLLEIRDQSDWLQEIERRLAQQGAPSERMEKLEKQREDCHDLKQSMDEKADEITDSIKEAATLVGANKVDSKDEGAQQLQKLKSSTSDLRVRLDSTSAETTKRCKRLDDMCDDLEDFYSQLQDLDQWLDTAIERSEDLKTAHDGVDVQYSNFKEFIEELQGKEEELAKVIKMADNFKDQAQEFEKEAETFRKRLQFMPPIQEEGDSQVIDEEMESLESKFKDISRDCAKHLDKLTGLAKHKKTFDDVLEKLGNIYPNIEQKLGNIEEENFGKDAEEDKQNYAQLKDLKADLIGQERKLKDFTNAADKLVAGLMEMGEKEKADEIKKKVEEIREKHDALSEEIADKEQNLDKAVSQQQSVVNRVEGLKNWATEAENMLDDRPLISLDKDKLNQQLQDQRVMNAEIETNKGLVERLSQEAANTSSAQDATEALADLSEFMSDLEKKAEMRTFELEEVMSSINDIDALMGNVDGWVTEAIKSLKNKPKGTTQKALKAKVDTLYSEKREHEFDMENLRNTSRKLMDDDNVCDQFVMKEGLSEVESKWHELTELLVQQVSLEALTEVDGMLRYLDKAENDINTAEPISIEPETLGVQLKENLSFNADLNDKRNAVKDIINKCNKMLRETTNSQTDEIKSRLEDIKSQADIVCQLSADRLQQLEAALPLATSFSESQAEVSGWLDEMEAELKTQGSPGDSLEQVKKQHESLKTTQQIIDDRKPFIDDLNATGLELMELCGDSDASEIQNKLVNVNDRFVKLKSQARNKLRDMTDVRQNMTQEVSDGLDYLLEDLSGLNRLIVNADPISANPDKLKDDLEENRIIMEELERSKPHIHRAIEGAKKVVAQGSEDEIEADDIKQKISELNGLANDIADGAAGRETALQEALDVADRFHDLCGEVMTSLRDLKDNMISQEPPGVDPQTVKEQQKELKELRKELGKSRLSLDECRQKGEQLGGLVGDPGLIEIRKQLEDIHNLADDVHDIAKEREEDLRVALGHADRFQQLQEAIDEWLPSSQHKLANMNAVSPDVDTLGQQIEELKSFKASIHPHVTEIQQLNQELSALKDMSHVAAETLQRPVDAINTKWAEIIQAISEREANLQEMQCQVGDIERAMVEVTSSLENAMTELNLMDIITGDTKCLEKHLKKLNLLQSDVKGKERASRKLNKALEDVLSKGEGDSPHMREVQEEMNEMLRRVQADSRDKEAKLQEKLRQVKKYIGDVDDMIQWLNDLRTELKSNTPFGALPDTAKVQFDKFRERHQQLQHREEPVKTLLEKGQEFLEVCPPEDVLQVSDRMRKLKDLWSDTRDRAQKRKDRMDEHLLNIDEFHGILKNFTDWLNNAEIKMRGFKYPSKLVPKILKQMEDHSSLKTELDSQIEKMHSLDRTGTYLKHFGRKQDTIYIKNLLVGIKLRWKKLHRRTDERGRLFKHAFKEDKRFYDAWKALCDWLDESAPKLTRFMSPGYASKQDVDELKDEEGKDVERFQHQLAAKHPAFYSASRLGRNLKDRCTKTDPEREELQQMLDDLKNKWNSVRSVVSKSQNKLDEALLTSGRVADALSSMLEWLSKVQASLGEEQPILGDLDTVSMLIEQHKALQQELSAREQTVAAMKASGNLPPVQLEELNTLWDSVNMLADVRESKLKESLQLAEEFQSVVQVMREFLPQAEAELKFKALPEDEVAIIQLIEKHEKFQAELRGHQDNVDKIKMLAEEILLNCHPNAIRFVKYYLTITQTRWDQLLQRAKSREQRLQEALRGIQGNAALVEELLSWLTEAQVLLVTKEKDPIPDDLSVVETLCKEHSEFHEDINLKNADVERLTKILQHEPKSPGGPRAFGSHSRLNEIDTHNPRVIALQNRWRMVWRMSVDRKKNLDDALDTLMEMESIKNFDFELWKVRYLKWIQAKKMRITDFFRRQDKDGDGFLSRDEFVNGMLQSGFKTNKTELNAVFDIFERENRDFIEYQEFIEAMKKKRHQKERIKGSNKMMSDTELIHDEIDREVALCSCRSPLRVEMVDEGKYRFGEKSAIRLVRFLNSTVMVRVGGGWITLEEFLENNDPCRARGRTNFDLRKTLGGAETPTSPNGNSTFRSRSGSGTYGYKSRPSDHGYASSVSSAGSSGDSSLRRSKQMTSSMVNLSGNSKSNFVNSLRKHPDFGSSGSLTRSKRLSSSSSNITTPTKPRTPSNSGTPTPRYMSPRQPFGRSTTPTPTTAFGRSTTPTPPRSSGTPRASSTPKAPRSGRQTPTAGGRATPTASGRTTPTMSNGSRRLPTTPKPKV
ncbi:microtubule-actin cross-linking factor 1, isoforms 1/2/3/4/5-like isoform X2 [Mya arenaria]|uniref:microtubule-actin cross-linking factor 1, isoforms 1/2/3/4/5-like isoform X2 n=1 Tax=Mya arenaria TaxID=6604 RepID=UPI0022E67B4B|nr:microtubule-actin cross-linking factor 1, isoforms 1/2/3/4/5-like isoform X2 [Mya arenaria]